jgi:hypothetical protein
MKICRVMIKRVLLFLESIVCTSLTLTEVKNFEALKEYSS